MQPVPDPAPDPPDSRTARLRGRASVGLVVLATVSVFASTLAVWSHAVLLDTDRWVRTVGPLAADERVTDALARWGAEEIVTAIEVEELAAGLLPERAGFLAGPASEVVEGFLADQLAAVLASDRFESVWVEGNRIAHRRAVALVRGEPGAVAATDGQVTLNLIPLLVWALERVDDLGLLPSTMAVPEVDASTPPSVAAAELSASLGVEVPESFGQVVLFENQDLRQAQQAVRAFDRLVMALVVTSVVTATAAVATSLHRARTATVLGIATLVTIAVTVLVVDLVEAMILGRIDDPEYRGAVAVISRTVLTSLREVQVVVLVGAVVLTAVAVAAWWQSRRSDGVAAPPVRS